MKHSRSDRLLAALVGVGLAMALPRPAHAQVKVSSLPTASALTGGELLPAVQGGADVVVTPNQIKTFTGGGSPGGSSGQLQYDSAGAFGGFTMAGDCTIAVPAIICLKTGGVSFAPSATTDTTNAANIVSGVLAGGLLSGSYTGITGVGALSVGSVPASLVTGLGTFATQNAPTGSTQCLQVNSSGVVAGSGGSCGGSLGSQGANTVLANFTGSSAVPTANSVPSCSAIGNYLQYTSASGFHCLAPAAPLKVTPSNPGTTAASSVLMLGIGSTATFTPNATGRVLITVYGDNNVSTADIVKAQIYYGTGTAPSNGASATGTAIGTNLQMKNPTSGDDTPFSLTYIITGLTVGAAYWIDLGVSNTAGATLTMQDLSVTAVEF